MAEPQNALRQSGGRPDRSPRRGISLLEVIACTLLVTILIVPIAGVIRASGLAITRASGDGSLESQTRRSLRWLSQTIRDNAAPPPTILSGGRGIRLQLDSGRTAVVAMQGSQLVIDDGIQRTVLADSASRFRVSTRTDDGRLLGLDLLLELRDDPSRTTHTAVATVALP